jgi:hypothetical protein
VPDVPGARSSCPDSPHARGIYSVSWDGSAARMARARATSRVARWSSPVATRCGAPRCQVNAGSAARSVHVLARSEHLDHGEALLDVGVSVGFSRFTKCRCRRRQNGGGMPALRGLRNPRTRRQKPVWLSSIFLHVAPCSASLLQGTPECLRRICVSTFRSASYDVVHLARRQRRPLSGRGVDGEFVAGAGGSITSPLKSASILPR